MGKAMFFYVVPLDISQLKTQKLLINIPELICLKVIMIEF